MDAIEKTREFWPEWTIEEALGRGSYGKVYSASRSDAGKKYYSAIKVMTIPSGEEEIELVRAEGLDEQSTREYFREIVQGCIQEITMMMDYRGTANIVNVEDYKVVEHTDSIGWDIFIRMERLLCLKEIMKTRFLSEDETINLGIDISTALIDCEMDDVIHRDIKPANIFLHPKTGVYKLGDFGIATRMSRAEQGMSRKGTYDYMAPEIFTANSYDQTVDIYALGLVLYRLCNENKGPFIDLSTGTLRPSDAERAHGLRLSGIELPAPAHASPDLAMIIGKAVRFRPEERYRDAKQMKEALEGLRLKRRQAKAEKVNQEQTLSDLPGGYSERTRSDLPGGNDYRTTYNMPGENQAVRNDNLQMPGNPSPGSGAYSSGARSVGQTAPYAAGEDVTEMLTYVSAQSRGSGNQNAGSQTPGSQIPQRQIPQSQIPQSQIPRSQIPQSQIPEGQIPQRQDTQGPISQDYYGPQSGSAVSGTGRSGPVQPPYIPPAKVRSNGETGRRQRESGVPQGEERPQSGNMRGTLVAALLGVVFGLLLILTVVFVFRDRVGGVIHGKNDSTSSQTAASSKQEKDAEASKEESSKTKDESANAESNSAKTDSGSSGEKPAAGPQFISLKEIQKVNPEVTPTSLVYMDSARDNFGTSYKSAIAGGTSEMENADEYILDGKYRTIAGRVVMNYDTRANVGKDTYVRIYGDGNLLWESGRVTRGFVPQDFQVDISGVSRMKLTIQGCNFIRLVDCVISEEETINGNSTAEGIIDNIVSGDHAGITDIDWYSSSMQLSPSEGGLVFYGSAVDNYGTVYNSTAFGGRASDTENWNSYRISGAYSSITGKVILNNAYSNIVSENTQFRIYADGEVVYESQPVTAGRGPQDFNVNLKGVEDLRLEVYGANYIRVVECTLNK